MQHLHERLSGPLAYFLTSTNRAIEALSGKPPQGVVIPTRGSVVATGANRLLKKRLPGSPSGERRLEAAAADLALGPLVVELPTAQARAARTATEEEAYALANGTDYGLTAGIFSRSPATIERASRAIEAGNVYANRAITAARVGVEPFGGMKMSGTGPKAGGSDYLWCGRSSVRAPRLPFGRASRRASSCRMGRFRMLSEQAYATRAR